MKKLITVFLALVISFSLVSCSNDVLTVNNTEFIDTFTYEVNNGQFFYGFTSVEYYIDTVTGEKVEF